jgi:seryl-tRNA synthetase
MERSDREAELMTTITEERMKRVEARLTAVEQAQNDNTQSLRFILTTVAQMKAVQDELVVTVGEVKVVQDQHTKTLDHHGKRLDSIEAELRGVRGDITALRKDFPNIVAEAVREGMRDKK